MNSGMESVPYPQEL